jgi:hypothetical protein
MAALKLSPDERNRLRQNLVRHFSVGELELLCTDLGVDHQSIPGHTEGIQVWTAEIIAFFERRDELELLIIRCIELRPRVAWRDSASARSPFSPPAPEINPVTAIPISEGLAALHSLMQIPDVTREVGVYRDNLEDSGRRIGMVSEYKTVHDRLLSLELCFNTILPLIARNRNTSPDQTAWEALDSSGSTLQVAIDQVVTFTRSVSFAAEVTDWTNTLDSALVEFKSAVSETNADRLYNATGRIRRVLGSQLSNVNAKLVTRAKDLQLADLARQMNALRDRLGGLGQIRNNPHATRRLKIFEDGITNLVQINAALTAMSDEHDSWQQVDNELRRIVAFIEKDPIDLSELVGSWDDVQRPILRLCANRQEDWAKALVRLCSDLKNACAGDNPNTTRRLFRDLRSKVTARFDKVDQDLLKLCAQLIKAGGQPLNDILKQL